MSHQRQASSGSSYDPAAAAPQYYQQQRNQQQQYNIVPPIGHAAPPPPLQHRHDPALAHQQPLQPAHMHLLQSFWINQMHEIENVPQDYKLHHLPLARIKKVMKTDEDVKAKMISAEAPMIFDKGCEIFITELTIRAWIHAEENKRRTLQRSDIAAAITKTDMFDFLIDIESFPPMGSSAGAPVPGSINPGGFEGYGYPYAVIENGSFAMGAGEAMNPYQQQQQQQQQLQLQYMGAQMAQQGHQQPQSQRYDFQPQQQQPPSHDNESNGSSHPSQLPSAAW
ncbi:hypothetical protein BGZ54_003954 [Gamsiella multidivaricata]|nr:hypothetical protein BGZ54_003954 [Gamsiella multidivaricata]